MFGSSKTQILILLKHRLIYWLTLASNLAIIMAKPTGTEIAKNLLILNYRTMWHLSLTYLWLIHITL